MRRNTSSRLRFVLVMYYLYTPGNKAARSLSCSHLCFFDEGRPVSGLKNHIKFSN